MRVPPPKKHRVEVSNAEFKDPRIRELGRDVDDLSEDRFCLDVAPRAGRNRAFGHQRADVFPAAVEPDIPDRPLGVFVL